MTELAHAQDEQSALSTSVTDAWLTPTNVCRILGSQLTANNKYLIIARAKYGSAAANTYGSLRVTTADDATVETKSVAVMENSIAGSSTQLAEYLYIDSYETSASPDDIEFEIRSWWAPQAAYLDQLFLMLLDLTALGTDNYIEASAGALDWGEDTWTANAEITTLEANTEYLVLGSVSIDVGSDVYAHLTRLLLDGTTVRSHTRREGEDLAETWVDGHMTAFTTASPAEDVGLYGYSLTAGNHNGLNSYIIAIKASAFADFEYVYSETGAAFTTQTTLETINYTPSEGGAHLILGRFGVTNGAVVAGEINVDGVSVMAGDIDAYTFGNWDTLDNISTSLFGYIDITATVDVDLDAVSASGAETSAYEFLAILNLNLVAVAAGPIHGHRTPLAFGRR